MPNLVLGISVVRFTAEGCGLEKFLQRRTLLHRWSHERRQAEGSGGSGPRGLRVERLPGLVPFRRKCCFFVLEGRFLD